MLPANRRGVTTQNLVLSVRNGIAWRFISAVTISCDPSLLRTTLVTRPRSTSLCLMWDCPACKPSPLSKVMVMVGPRLEIVFQASQPPISAVDDRDQPDQGKSSPSREARGRRRFERQPVQLNGCRQFVSIRSEPPAATGRRRP